jgi:type IV secretion system protein TrbL
MTARAVSLVVLVVGLLAVGAPTEAAAAPDSNGGTSRDQTASKGQKDKCKVAGVPVPTGIGQKACKTAGDVKRAVTGVPGQVAGDVAGAAAGSVFDQLTKWITDGASWLTGQIAKAIDRTTTPELQAGWYEARFKSMAALGLGLAVLVAMVALASAALRRDPEALGATFIGMFRAGIGTAVVVGLTAMALAVADDVTTSISEAAVGKNATEFWSSVGRGWRSIGNPEGDAAQSTTGSSTAGQVTSTVVAGKAAPPPAVAFFFALVSVVAGFAVWIELLLRSAAIYVAVLFMPAALAAGVWPSLRSWQSKLTRALFVLIAMKPVVVTVLALAGSAATAALAGQASDGVGVLLAAVVIFALAAWAPWALLHLISIDYEGHLASRGGVEGARGAALAGGGQLGGPVRRGSRPARSSGGSGGGGTQGASGGGGTGRGPGASGGAGQAATGGRGGGKGATATTGGGAAGGASVGGAAGSGVALGAVSTAAGMWKGGQRVGAQAGATGMGASGGGTPGAGVAGGASVAPQRNPGVGDQLGDPRGVAGSAPALAASQSTQGDAHGNGGRTGGRSQLPSPQTGQRPGGTGRKPRSAGG